MSHFPVLFLISHNFVLKTENLVTYCRVSAYWWSSSLTLDLFLFSDLVGLIYQVHFCSQCAATDVTVQLFPFIFMFKPDFLGVASESAPFSDQPLIDHRLSPLNQRFTPFIIGYVYGLETAFTASGLQVLPYNQPGTCSSEIPSPVAPMWLQH